MSDAVFLSSPEGHRLTFRADLKDQIEIHVPEAFVAQGAEPDFREVTVPADLIRRLIAAVLETSTLEPSDAPSESRTVAFAREELRRAGMFDEDADYGGLLGRSVLDTIRVFCSAGHSGCSAGIALQLLDRLLRHKPLTPLTADPAEWLDCSEMTDGPLWQSRRSPSCFSLDGGATWYDQDGDPEDVLARAGCAVRHLFPGRKVATISRTPRDGDSWIDVRFADDVVAVALPPRDVLAAWAAYKGPREADAEPDTDLAPVIPPV